MHTSTQCVYWHSENVKSSRNKGLFSCLGPYGDQRCFLALVRLILLRFDHTFFSWIRNFKGYNFVIDNIASTTRLHGVFRCRSIQKIAKSAYARFYQCYSLVIALQPSTDDAHRKKQENKKKFKSLAPPEAEILAIF